MYELVIDRKPEYEPYQAIFHVYPHIDKFHLGDLFSPHSEKEGLWLPRDRADDLVKLAYLAKFRVRDVEAAVEAHPAVKGALMDGQGRDVPFLLVELDMKKVNGGDEKAVLEEIWRVVEDVTAHITPEVRVRRDMVLLADPARPLTRNLKATLNRSAILETYKEDIEALYTTFEGKWKGTGP